MSDRIYHSKEELLSQANLLLGKSFSELYNSEEIKKVLKNRKLTDKGNLGKLVEEIHYGIKNNNNSEPDVKNLGIEIKTNPLKTNVKLKRGEISPKEPIKLGKINYDNICNEDFESSSFLKKCRKILFNFHFQDLKYPQIEIERKFILIDLINIYDDIIDLSVIKKDWHIIQNKFKTNNSHNISSSDTDYLVAKTAGNKGQKSKSHEEEMNSKSKAFYFHADYIRNLLNKYDRVKKEDTLILTKKNKKIKSFRILSKDDNGDINAAVIRKFKIYINQTDYKISESFNYQDAFIEMRDKTRWHYLTSYILCGERKKFLSKHIDEFSKSGLTVKTIRVNESNLPKEEVSFRTQNYEITEDSKWEDSDLFYEMSRKFLWVIYKEKNNTFKLENVFFWKMPDNDLEFISEKWHRFKKMQLEKNYKPSYFQDEDSFYFLKIKDNVGGMNRTFDNQQVTNLSHWIRKSYVKIIIDNDNKISI